MAGHIAWEFHSCQSFDLYNTSKIVLKLFANEDVWKRKPIKAKLIQNWAKTSDDYSNDLNWIVKKIQTQMFCEIFHLLKSTCRSLNTNRRRKKSKRKNEHVKISDNRKSATEYENCLNILNFCRAGNDVKINKFGDSNGSSVKIFVVITRNLSSV